MEHLSIHEQCLKTQMQFRTLYKVVLDQERVITELETRLTNAEIRNELLNRMNKQFQKNEVSRSMRQDKENIDDEIYVFNIEDKLMANIIEVDQDSIDECRKRKNKARQSLLRSLSNESDETEYAENIAQMLINEYSI